MIYGQHLGIISIFIRFDCKNVRLPFFDKRGENEPFEQMPRLGLNKYVSITLPR